MIKKVCVWLLLLMGVLASAALGETEQQSVFACVRTDGPLDRLNVRHTASEEFSAYCKLWPGVRVRVTQRQDGWAYIEYGTEADIAQIRGYVQDKYLDFEADDDAELPAELPRIRMRQAAFFMRNTGWYYPWPESEQDVLAAGTECTVIAVKGSFDLTDPTADFDAFYVEADDGRRFWIRNLADFDIEVITPTGYTAKTTANVRMRQAADTQSKAIYSLKSGAKVDVLLRGEGWTMVSYRGQTGYIMSRYLLFS